MLDITHMLMLKTAQCLQVSLQQKSLIYSPRDTIPVVSDWLKNGEKKMQRDNVHQRQRRTPSFHIAITATY